MVDSLPPLLSYHSAHHFLLRAHLHRLQTHALGLGAYRTPVRELYPPEAQNTLCGRAVRGRHSDRLVRFSRVGR